MRPFLEWNHDRKHSILGYPNSGSICHVPEEKHYSGSLTFCFLMSKISYCSFLHVLKISSFNVENRKKNESCLTNEAIFVKKKCVIFITDNSKKKLFIHHETLPRSVMKRPTKNAKGLCEVFLRITWICSLHVWVRQTHTRQCLSWEVRSEEPLFYFAWMRAISILSYTISMSVCT